MTYELVTHHEVEVDGDAAKIDRALRDVTFGDLPLVRALLFARGLGLPSRDQNVFATVARRAQLLEDVPGSGAAFRLERRFWRLRGGGSEQPATATLRFSAAPGLLSTETRVRVPEGSTGRFRRYWLVVGPFSGVIRRHLLGAAKRRAERAA